MLGDGVSFRIDYRNNGTVLGFQEKLTLQELEDWEGEEVAYKVFKFMWENLRKGIKNANRSN